MLRLWSLILLSLFLHFLLSVGVYYVPVRGTVAKSDVEIELIENEKPNDAFDKQMVRGALVPKDLQIESKEETPFVSKERVRVRKETRAAQSGLTVNRVAEATKSKSSQAQQLAQKAQKELNSSSEAGEISTAEKANGVQMPREFRELRPQGVSTIGEALAKEVEVGSFTALNTDRGLFYTFYARIDELIRYRWESRIEAAQASFPRAYLLQLPKRDRWTSQIEIWLTKEGRYHSAHIFRESGIPAFEAAAIGALKDAAVFPNPPAEMAKDGFIKLNYRFTIYWEPGAILARY